MAWMSTLAGVKMSLRIGEALPAAVPALMDMEREKARFRFRQAADFGSDHSAVPARRKADGSVQIRMLLSTLYLCLRLQKLHRLINSFHDQTMQLFALALRAHTVTAVSVAKK